MSVNGEERQVLDQGADLTSAATPRHGNVELRGKAKPSKAGKKGTNPLVDAVVAWVREDVFAVAAGAHFEIEERQKRREGITRLLRRFGVVDARRAGDEEEEEEERLLLEQILPLTPRRWVVYPPMVLLPAGSFGASRLASTGGGWFLAASAQAEQDVSGRGERDGLRMKLWRRILRNIETVEGKRTKLTHLAITAGIPLMNTEHSPNVQTRPHPSPPLAPQNSDSSPSQPHRRIPPPTTPNILRTPSSMILLAGDFGPVLPPARALDPSPTDLAAAFWVQARQNGLVQVWAPRYTMFSRGNVKEKARVLGFGAGWVAAGGDDAAEKDLMRRSLALDLYAGIGYFVFSYVRAGMGRVVGWELNPWSVEGMRRAAALNQMTIRIIVPSSSSPSPAIKDPANPTDILIFQEPNEHAPQRFQAQPPPAVDHAPILHVNCGLLPSSLPVWRPALRLVLASWARRHPSASTSANSALHLHENVASEDITPRSGEIERLFGAWLREEGGGGEGDGDGDEGRGAWSWSARVAHVEKVKSFAPGVWHCVFDLELGGELREGG